MSFVKEQLILGLLLSFLNAQSVLEDCLVDLNFEMLQRVHLRDLYGEDLIAFPIGSYVRHEVEKLLKQDQVECRIKLSTRSTGDIYQFVKHGAGISLIFPFDQFGDSTIPGLTFCELEEELCDEDRRFSLSFPQIFPGCGAFAHPDDRYDRESSAIEPGRMRR